GKEVSPPHNFHQARYVVYRTVINGHEFCARTGRIYHATVKHSWYAHVLDKTGLPGELWRNIDALHCGAYNFVIFWALERRIACDLSIKPFAPHQRTICDFTIRMVRDRYYAVSDNQFIGCSVELIGSHFKEPPARFCRCGSQQTAAAVNGHAACCVPFVGCAPCVAQDDLDPVKRHVKLFGHDLAE